MSCNINGWDEIQTMAAVESKGQTIVYGRRTQNGPYSLYMIQHSKAGVVVETPMDYPCEHTDSNIGLFTVMRNDRELLAVSCSDCCGFYLVDMETGTIADAFKLPRTPFIVCSGINDGLFVFVWSMHILELDNSFNVIKTFDPDLDYCQSMHYLPAPCNALVALTWKEIIAFSIPDTSEMWRWQHKGFKPLHLLFCQQQNTLLVSNRNKPEVVIVNPLDGRTIQIIRLPRIAKIKAMGLCNNHVIMIQEAGSFFRNPRLASYSFKASSGSRSTRRDVISHLKGGESEKEEINADSRESGKVDPDPNPSEVESESQDITIAKGEVKVTIVIFSCVAKCC